MYSPFRHSDSIFWKSRPIHLTFFVTRRCNSYCPFCFYLKNTDTITSKEKELSIDEISRISSSLGNLLWLAFSGGEIFLREDLVEISRIFYDKNKPAIMLFPTNGLLSELIRDRTEQILKHCANSVVTVKLSVDGLNEDHDVLRNTPGSFEKTMRTYELLGDLLNKYPNFELGVNSVFCSENQDRIDNIIDYVARMKNIKTHTISLIRGNLSDSNFKKVDFSKYHNAIERLEKNLKDRTSSTYRFKGARIKAAQDILQRQMIYKTMNERKRLIPCYAGRLNLVLSENGDVFPCEILTESMGNVREQVYDINKILKSKRSEKIINAIRNKQCFCTHECYFMTNILFNPALYPTLFREYIQL